MQDRETDLVGVVAREVEVVAGDLVLGGSVKGATLEGGSMGDLMAIGGEGKEDLVVEIKRETQDLVLEEVEEKLIRKCIVFKSQT